MSQIVNTHTDNKECRLDGRALLNGVYGGLIGGVAFGVMMGFMGMLPMIGKMVGQPSAGFGFFVHLIISAIIGIGFSITLGKCTTGLGKGVGNGLLYGGIWWLLGPLTLMPLFMGMGFGVNWSLVAATKMLPSLMGHLIYGGILGIAYVLLKKKGIK